MKKSTIKAILVALFIIGVFVAFGVASYFMFGIQNLESSNGEPASFGEKLLATGTVSGIILFFIPEFFIPAGIIIALIMCGVFSYKTTKGSKDDEK